MRTTFTFRSAGNLVFGRHAVRELGSILDRAGAKRVFVVTDKILASVGIVDQVKEAAGRPVEVFDGGEPEPTLGMVLNGIAAAKAFRPDAIVGLGGGSNMDAAKPAAVVLGHGGDPRDYVGENKVPGPILPLVCVPTTAGTGSEVSAAAVFTNTEISLKVSVLSYYLRPAAAIVDPLLTVSCPPKVTADSGIDALTHAIEGFTAVDNATYPLPPGETSVYQGKNPLADMCAEKAITLVGRTREVDGNDLGPATDGPADVAGWPSRTPVPWPRMESPVGAVRRSHRAGNGLPPHDAATTSRPGRRRTVHRRTVATATGSNGTGAADAPPARWT